LRLLIGRCLKWNKIRISPDDVGSGFHGGLLEVKDVLVDEGWLDFYVNVPLYFILTSRELSIKKKIASRNN